MIPLDSDRVISGRYYGHSGALVVGASADTPPAGRIWLFNPVGNTVNLALRRIDFQSQHGSVLATPTSPRIVVARFTATGTASGTAITPGQHDSTDAAATAKLVSANTGLSITNGAIIRSFLPVVALTAVGAAPAYDDDWVVDPAYPTILRAGEGIVVYQADAGTSSDTRRFTVDIVWDEFQWP